LIKICALIAVGLLAALPLASAHQNPSFDMTAHIKDRSCYCHGAEPSGKVPSEIDCPDQVAFTAANKSVIVEIAITGGPQNNTGFGLLLTPSLNETGVRWQNRFGDGPNPPENLQKVETNGTVLYNVKKVIRQWFNVSFVPGQTDQFIELVVMGMRSNDNGNESGDLWAVASKQIEVKKQRLFTLNVTVKNDQPISASNIKVDYYIDDDYIGNATLPHIEGNSQENLSLDWDATFAEDGYHDFKAVIDPDGNLTEVNRDNNVITKRIWIGEVPDEDEETFTYAGVAAIVAAVVLISVFFYRRRKLYQF
jgi:hypothetical protein